MVRFLLFIGSLLLAFISISSAGFAAEIGELRFALSLSPGNNGQVRFRVDEADGGRDRHSVDTSSTMPARDLIGLAPQQLLGPGSRPLRFALVRDAGRLDCGGSGGEGRGSGRCLFSADQRFTAMLRQFGVRTDNRRELLGMMLLNVTRDLVLTVRQAGYVGATGNDLAGLAALGVTPAYIRELDRRGYRPDHLSDLTAFKALGVTPEYVDALVRAGFGRIPPREIVQLKALGVSPDYLAQLRSAGYAPFRSSEVAQMRALGVTPADYARFRRVHGTVEVNKLVEAKALGLVDRDR